MGTTGFDDARLDRSAAWLADAPGRRADRPQLLHRRHPDDALRRPGRPFYESVEVVELHHPDKADAPSGTARRTAELIAAARREAGCRADARRDVHRPRRAPVAPTSTAIRVHGLRIRGLVAHQEVVLGGLGRP